MKKIGKGLLTVMLVGSILCSSNTLLFATENSEIKNSEMENSNVAAEVEEIGDDVIITSEDKPYLALGADLSAEQQHTVLSLMGINVADLEKYDVVYVNNKEEHQYLDAYISSSAIGTRALSSVVITKTNKGDGLRISAYNINYCTIGMYKNALTTAGISDANIIVAGPFELSGTCALVGILKAYEELTGETLNEDIVDAAMDELVTTGLLNESIDADPEVVEALIADLKEQIAKGALQSEESMRSAIEKTAKEYGVSLTEEEKERLIRLLDKLKGLDLDWKSIADQAANWAENIGNKAQESGFWDKLAAIFRKLMDAIKAIFGQ